MDKIKCEDCEELYRSQSVYRGLRYMCRLLDRDVTSSVFGRNSPRVCPKRNYITETKNKGV